jgi:hypothetical protein
MIYHFVNLVSWKGVSLLKNNYSKIFYDSISFTFVSRLFGVRLKRNSGVGYYLNNFEHLKNSLFLVNEKSNLARIEIELPFWNKIDEIYLDEDLLKIINNFDSIVIGISSPKQDYLASLIINKFPKKNIYCLGAAIYSSNNQKKIFDRLGFSFLYFMFSNPIRTLNKIYLTVKEFILLIFTNRKKDFKQFIFFNSKKNN